MIKALITNAIKASIDNSQKDCKCSLREDAEKIVEHLICGCKTIAQTDYLERHNKMATMIQLNLQRTIFQRTKTGGNISQANIPDITVVQKKCVWIINIAVSSDSLLQQQQKITRYKDLQIEILQYFTNIWSVWVFKR